MKKIEKEIRGIFIKFRVNETELAQITRFQKESTEKSLSNYLRKIALQKPVAIKYHNQSADEILTELIKIKNELHAIGNNINQAVHKLHTLDRIAEFRSWIVVYESTRQTLEIKTEELVRRMNQIYEQWLQK